MNADRWIGLVRHGFLAGLLVTSAWLGAACGPPNAKTALAKRPIDEGRAAKIIAESLQKEGLQAAAPKVIKLAGKNLTLDVTIEGKKFAVVYLSPNDQTELGDSPITKKKQLPGDPLRIETGTADDGMYHFVVLYATDYQYDDNEGHEHEATVITAENKLDRDVRDFVMIARREHFE
ncbi:MAG: hypothetical protein HY898_07275 [Deltaproteobacteria bacterium]|nr:hypothetical protein [Deltaproteobacteria bacterium]